MVSVWYIILLVGWAVAGQAQNLTNTVDSTIFMQCISVPKPFFQDYYTQLPSCLGQLNWSNISKLQEIYQQSFRNIPFAQIGQKRLQFRLSSRQKKELSQIKKSLKQATDSTKRPILFMLHLVHKGPKKAAQWLKQHDYTTEERGSFYELLAFFYWLEMDTKQSIDCLKKSLKIRSSYKTYYQLGFLYAQQQQWEKAAQIFDQLSPPIASNNQLTCAQMAILIQQQHFEQAFQLIQSYPASTTDDIYKPSINYFMAITTLAQGDKNDAFKRLKAIHAQSEYKVKANQLLEHFFKWEDDN